ncbi:MAG: nucleotide sugar dehydrogenase [Bacilli bacterium]|nr:nucleotide sugar dehydrogenase [Bacilli bacterium]
METKMKVGVLGLGYIGLANAAVLATVSKCDVIAYDVDEKRIERLNKGDFYLAERRLNEVLSKTKKKLAYTSNPDDLEGLDAYFICVGTPAKEDGSCDLTQVNEAVDLVARKTTKETYLVIRSTVEIGTGTSLREDLEKENTKFHVISLPEFLAEGTAYEDEEKPSRFVVGVDDHESFDFIRSLRKDAINEGIPFYEMNHESAELTKYASNTFLAAKLSFMNEMSHLAEETGADITDVAKAVGADPRIGHSMFKVSLGYGGACLPKDVSALGETYAKKLGIPSFMISATRAANILQYTMTMKKIMDELEGYPNVRIAIIGLSFKAGISDIRNSPIYDLLEALTKEKGLELALYDVSKEARESSKELYPDYHVADTMDEALMDADAVLFAMDDPSYKEIEEAYLLKLMRGRTIFDCRNLFSLYRFKNFKYISMGRPIRNPIN